MAASRPPRKPRADRRRLSNIEDYALIGDCQTAALVGRDGSIDWLCWPRFDSPGCFAALLGGSEHGRWMLHPADDVRHTTRQYRDHSLVLESRFETGSGVVTVVDFMPPRGDNSDVVRLVRGESGRVRMAMELVLRFDYGSIVPWVSRLADGTWRAIAGPDMVVLRTPVKLTGRDFTTVAEFDVNGDSVIDERDPVFSGLRLWLDRNVNGVTDAGELTTLADHGISGLDLSYRESRRRDQYGNEFRYRAKVYGSRQTTNRFCYDVIFVGRTMAK